MSFPRPIRDRIQARRDVLAAELIGRGATEEQAMEAVAKVESEHPILDWLIKIDWATLLALALKFLPLILAKPAEESEPGTNS